MKGVVVPLHDDLHLKVQALIPWYVTGRLDAADLSEVEAHFHACAQCQVDVKAERRLSAEIADLPMAGEPGWERVRRRLKANPPRRSAVSTLRAGCLAGGRHLRGPWAIAVQFCLLIVVGLLAWPMHKPSIYHALGAPPPPPGNIIVIFRPDIQERELRKTLRDSNARLVDGPTATDGYVLSVPPHERAATLTKLRTQAQIELAEPIDGEGTR